MYTHKKSLGQHFLHDENICQEIVALIKELKPLPLLEIGPGAGALSKYILPLEKTYKAIEIDSEKVNYLSETFPAIKDKIIHADFLKTTPPFETPFNIIGNFPYNISSQILFKILDWENQVQGTIGMFQKEVAQRIASKSGSKVYGILSVLIQAYFTVEYKFDVPPQCFTPPPKVMSGVLLFHNLNNPYNIKNKKAFFNLVKTAFNQRRKTLRNGLKGLITIDRLTDAIFDKRAEQLTVTQFVELYREFYEKE